MPGACSAIYVALVETEPARKCERVSALGPGDAAAMAMPPGANEDTAAVPGRPARPSLIHPGKVPHRGLGTAEGRAALIHAVAHIEFNAINLALDACWRFRGLPPDYYCDWLSVAQDEARHFGMLRARLRGLGCDYGDFPAHNGLWEAAEKTRHDVLVRMALVPRVLEARGLDVTPGMIERLRSAGDDETADLLVVILEEEVRHVAIGTRWFRYLCERRRLEPAATFKRLLVEQGMRIQTPVNRPARLSAGFDEAELPDGGLPSPD